jgi:hypothetical protein
MVLQARQGGGRLKRRRLSDRALLPTSMSNFVTVLLVVFLRLSLPSVKALTPWHSVVTNFRPSGHAAPTVELTADQIALAAGESAFAQVQWLGTRVAQKEQMASKQTVDIKIKDKRLVGRTLNEQKRRILHQQRTAAESKSTNMPFYTQPEKSNNAEVWEALASLEEDST